MLKKRSIVSCIILSLVTCGLYSIFWWININNEFAEKNNENINGGMTIFLTIMTCGIYGLIWNYKMGDNIAQSGGKNEGPLYLILFLLGFGIVSLALMQCQENDLCNIK
ncbi:DUF4234 domain-containing protein [uncultured Cetobacterium sp.]|uniref:DUF4234 domain-containing protein n=1 Tax=uncultured Cetobacterium sp. TaxID=527638 RepID=UPI00260EDECC|nr:DUF4234 domain-containing protein [uncultured Cetobacterium sp.]